MSTRRLPPVDSREDLLARGMLCACAVLAFSDWESQWREVVGSGGGYHYMRGISKRSGNLESDGFLQYAPPSPRSVERKEE